METSSMKNEPQENDDDLNTEEFIPGFPDVMSYTKNVLGAILKATRASNKVPSSGENYNFYNNFSGFRQLMKAEGRDVLELMTRILQHQGGKGSFQHADLDEKFDLLVDANDSLMEQVGSALDEASGLKKKDEAVVTTIKFTKPINTSWNKMDSLKSESLSLLAGKNVMRPQLRFSQKVDNSNSPFVPLIKYKPHSIKPLSILLEVDEEGQEVYSHPYEMEIEKFQPSEDKLLKVIPQIPKKLEETELIFVNTVSGFQKLCADLSQVEELAVDLENHSYRSFQGITCLMQISTRTRDYIVDTLELRDQLHQLNEIFANPRILKVLHGADMDVFWLQRDFGLYLVNLFDTGQAARVLNYSHFGLAFLLKHFCQVNPDKTFQLADWRIRPLTEQMVLYARQDTHYLLYIYDCMKNELLDKGNVQNNLLLSVIRRGNDLCLKRYQKPVHRDDSYLNLYRKSKKRLNTRQLYALKEMFSWRDKIARQEDESYGFVLPNHMMLQIAETLPREQQGLLASCNPIPPLVKQQLNELHLIILKAREWSEEKLSVPSSHLKLSETELQVHVKIETSLNCPHDLVQQDDAHLPTLLTDGFKQTPIHTSSVLKKRPELLAFSSPPVSEEKKNVKNSVQMRIESVKNFMEQMISPFQRFKLVEKESAVEIAAAEANLNKAVSEQEPSANAHVERVHQHFQNLIHSSKPNNREKTDDQSMPETNVTSASVKMQNIDEDEELNRPLMQQLPRKRKRKGQRPVPDVALSLHNQTQQTQAPKKEFQSFDFEKARAVLFGDKNDAGGSSDRKRSFDPNDNYFKAKRGKFSHRNRGAKSLTYGGRSQNANSKQWPKR